VFQQSEKGFGFEQRGAQLDGGKVHLGGGGNFVELVFHILNLHASSIPYGVGHL
jgi:hypothetical protein